MGSPRRHRWPQFSPSGLLLLTRRSFEEPSDTPDVLRLWDVIRGEEVAHFDGIGEAVNVAFVTEHELLIVESNRCQLWDSSSGTSRVVRKARNEQYRSGAASLVAGFVSLCVGEEILVLDYSTGKIRHRMHTPPTTDVNYDDMVTCGPLVAGVCRANRDEFTYVTLWDAVRGKRLRTYDLSDEGDVCPLAIRPDGTSLVVATLQAVYAFGLEHEEEMDGFTPHKTSGVYDLCYSPDGRTFDVLERGKRNQLQVVRLDAVTGAEISSYKIGADSEWHRARLDPTGDKVALAHARMIQIRDRADR